MYEQNLSHRLAELRSGVDSAYTIHGRAILEALMQTAQSPDPEYHLRNSRIVDVGCGLGFITADIKASIPGIMVVGVDSSERTIEIAKKEHSDTIFYACPIQAFAAVMRDEGISLFTHAVLNMVLHSVDDETALEILHGVHQCLVPDGALVLCVPTRDWLQTKLIEVAQSAGMERNEGIEWVYKQLTQTTVEIPFQITGGISHPVPLLVYNRSLEDYGNMLIRSGFGVDVDVFDENETPIEHHRLAYYYFNDWLAASSQDIRNRPILISGVR